MKILFAENPNETLSNFFSKKNYLIDEEMDTIIEVLDAISKYWLSENFKMKDLFNENSLGFIIPWLNKRNSLKLLNLNFKNYNYLNNPSLKVRNEDRMIARPLGTALHWLAGNVPVISLISLFQGILTKNKNIIKVSKMYQNLIPKIFFDLKKNIKLKNKSKKTFQRIISSIYILYVDHNDHEKLQYISKNVDLRIIWGGKEAVTKILNLQKKINCRDIVFGPKVSMAYISKNQLKNKNELSDFASKFTRDVFNFDQLGCNSPHNLFIQKGGKFSIKEIAKELSICFQKNISNKKISSSAVNKYNTLIKKFLHLSQKSNKLIASENHEWNIFINKDAEVEDPIYNRSIFISSVKDVKNLLGALPQNVQSFGLHVKDNERFEIIERLADLGIDRFPEIGKMSFYNNPWDGFLPMQNMVRWVSY
tara:strand:+ start:2023 stop:3288 length:1266 start_codon:yes stop_codon:yes gene_type:complete